MTKVEPARDAIAVYCKMSYKPDPNNDPNEIYAVIPTPAGLGGPTGWWTVTAHGVPVWHFPPDKRALAERFATDPAYRQQSPATGFGFKIGSQN